MALSILQNRNILYNALVAAAATLGIVINPLAWVSVPGELSETDYKLLTLESVASGMAFQGQLNDALVVQIEGITLTNPPQVAAWFQKFMLNFQFDTTGVNPQIPKLTFNVYTDSVGNQIQILAITWPKVLPQYQVISFCTVIYGSAGRCLVKVAAISGGIPASLDVIFPGASAAAQSYINLLSSPGISYVVSSGISDWLFLQLDLYYIGLYSAIIFSTVSAAITAFLNNLSLSSLSSGIVSILKLSALEEAILSVPGVDDVVFINVAGRPDFNTLSDGVTSTFGTILQQFLVSESNEIQRNYTTEAGYIALENGTSTGTPSPVPNSQLSDFRIGSSGILNLNVIPI